MTEDFLKKEIGTIEIESLKPANVQVQGIRLTPKKKKNTDEVVGELITLICKHPDREEIIELSNAKLIVNENVKLMALWYNLDNDKNLSKSSACALLLKHYNVASYNDLIDKEIETVVQSDKIKYLCIKAY